MALYHFEIGFPKNLPAFRPVIGLIPSRHAESACWNDRYGVITLPKNFLPGVAKVIEIETDERGNVVKILARQQHNERTDVVYAFLVQSKLIKTAWLQERNDLHKTLRRENYAVPA
jgi:hypothetical protein